MFEDLSSYKVIKNIEDDMFDKLVDLDAEFYDKKYLWDTNHQRQIYEKNKNSIIAVLKDDRFVGYINYLAISKEKYESIKLEDSIVDDYLLEDINEFYNDRYNYITINSIVISLEFQNGAVIKLISDNFQKEMARLNKGGYKIGGITSTAVSSDGRKFLERLGFKKEKELADGNVLYVLENNNLKHYLNKD